MQAALAVLQGNRKRPPDAISSGYPQWDRAVRWPLVNAGVVDPASKFDWVREQSPDHQSQVAWMHGLVEGFGIGNDFRASDLLNLPGTCDLSETKRSMYKDYLAEHPPKKGWNNAKSIGQKLGTLVGRIVEGYTLTKKIVNGTAVYTLART
jgi:hypothetical protein